MKPFAIKAATPRTPRNRLVGTMALGALFLTGFTTVSQPSRAQAQDLPRAQVVEQLDAQYAEAQTAVGVTQEGGVVEIFTTKDGSTWTLIVTKPDGTSRVVVAGETWIKR